MAAPMPVPPPVIMTCRPIGASSTLYPRSWTRNRPETRRRTRDMPGLAGTERPNRRVVSSLAAEIVSSLKYLPKAHKGRVAPAVSRGMATPDSGVDR